MLSRGVVQVEHNRPLYPSQVLACECNIKMIFIRVPGEKKKVLRPDPRAFI